MPVGGSLTLGDVASRVAVLVVACSRCDRAGRYNLDRLIKQRGPNYTIPSLLRALPDDCSKRTSISVNAQLPARSFSLLLLALQSWVCGVEVCSPGLKEGLRVQAPALRLPGVLVPAPR